MIIIPIFGGTQYEFCLDSIDDVEYVRGITFDKLMSGSTFAYDRGYEYDKFYSKFTIEDLDSDIFQFVSDIQNAKIKEFQIILNDSELIFGPGIEYVDLSDDGKRRVYCQITNHPIKSSQLDFAYGKLSLSVQGISVSEEQLSFTGPSTLPTNLAYQAPTGRNLTHDSVSFTSDSYASNGVDISINDTGALFSNGTDITIRANERDSGQIAKFVSVNRGVAFLWPDPNAPDLIPNLSTTPVLITKFKQRRVNNDLWDNFLTLVNGV